MEDEKDIRKTKLKSVTIRGFKSFDSQENTLELGDINVLIGANGAGKSNVVGFFEMVKSVWEMEVRRYFLEKGGAQTLLHQNVKSVSQIQGEVKFEWGREVFNHNFILRPTDNDGIYFFDDKIKNLGKDENEMNPYILGLNGYESDLRTFPIYWEEHNYKKPFGKILPSIRSYNFQNTSSRSPLRLPIYINDYNPLSSNGKNLPAFLYAMRNHNPKYFERIEKYIGLAMPQFGGFVLKPTSSEARDIGLDWKDKDHENVFGPHQISDGSLRFMALAALLLQPPETLPSLIIIDEPELGLHPEAIALLSAMVLHAAEHSQVILATQSPELLDEFEPEQIRVVEWDEREKSSRFKKLSQEELRDWTQDYSLSELWEKNLIGGLP